jgi:hypothetical protein
MSWPRSFAISGRSIDRASVGRYCKFNSLVLGQIQNGADITALDEKPRNGVVLRVDKPMPASQEKVAEDPLFFEVTF